MRHGAIYFRAMAGFYVAFGLITIFYPRLMQLFMTEQGIEDTTPFSDQVWLHGGLDILSVALLLVVLSLLPARALTLQAAAVVALTPATAILYTFLATPFWNPFFLVPGGAAFAFALYRLVLARSFDRDRTSVSRHRLRAA